MYGARYGYRLNPAFINGGGGSPLLLDTVTGAAAAFSLRLLRTAYSGDCIRVRRSSDNAEQDIGFSSGVLDESALTTFTGANDGFLPTWKDQSGNGNDRTQASTLNQARIVSSGVVDKENGKPAGVFDTTDVLTGTQIGSIVTTITVGKVNTQNTINYLIGSSSPNTGVFYNGSFGSTTGFGATDGTNFAQTGTEDLNQHLLTTYTSGGNMFLSLDGASAINGGTFTALTFQFIGGRNIGSINFFGDIQEVIVFTTDKSSQLSTINNNVNAFYSIY